MNMHLAQKHAFDLAKTFIGLKEIPGSEDNQEIVQMFKDVGHSWVKDDETAWCAAFVGSMLERSGLRSTRKLNARSYLDWGKPIPVNEIQAGDICIKTRGDVNGWTGHVFMATAPASAGTIKGLGGNQSNSVNIQRFKVSELLGVRRMPSTQGDYSPPLKVNDQFDYCVDAVFGREGGISDHPEDNGGLTNMGITIPTLSHYLGREATDQDIRNLTRKTAKAIYKKLFWTKMGCDQLPPGMNLLVFSQGVHSGTRVGPKALQKALGVEQDGEIGPKTISAAFSNRDWAKVIRDTSDYRMEYLQGLEDWRHFKNGWTNRVNIIEAAALSMAANNEMKVEKPTSTNTASNILADLISELIKVILRSLGLPSK